MASSNTVGRRIAAARNLRGLTQARLAEVIGVHPMVVSKWERGLVSPNASTLIKLCDALECSADFILGFSTDVGHA